MEVKNFITLEEIARSFDVFLELRPSLIDAQNFVQQVIAQQKEGYQLSAIFEEDEVVSCIGFRLISC